MCIERRLLDIYGHLNRVIKDGGIKDDIDRNHIIDALTEASRAIDELRNAPRAALIETIPSEERPHA